MQRFLVEWQQQFLKELSGDFKFSKKLLKDPITAKRDVFINLRFHSKIGNTFCAISLFLASPFEKLSQNFTMETKPKVKLKEVLLITMLNR